MTTLHRLFPVLLVAGLCGCHDKQEAFDEYKEECAAQVDRAGCNAVPGLYPDKEDGAYCQWEQWVPVELDGDMCVFGEPSGTCFAQGYGEYRIGCGVGTEGFCDGDGEGTSVVHRQTEDGIELSKQFFLCSAPLSTCIGTEDDPPECQCACDPAYP